MRGKQWLRVALIAAATAGLPSVCAPTFTFAQAETPADLAQKETDQLRATLFDKEKPSRERDEAAKRLLQRQANELLVEALRSGRSDLQVPVARALADTETPPPLFLDDLMRCLQQGISPDLAEAASLALANYRGNPAARARLRDFILSGNVKEPLSIPAVRALGTLNDKETAQFLVETVLRGDDPRISPRLSEAAADALVEMTGLTEYGRDMGEWDRWWRAQKPKTAEQFLYERRIEREVKARKTSEDLRQLGDSIDKFVEDGHRVITDEKDREAYVLRCLKNPQPKFRAAGARLVRIERNDNISVGPSVIVQLREMIGDSSSEVRSRVAGAIAAINDPEAAKPLLAQLQRERIPGVKASLIEALAPTKNLSAVPDLIKLLSDPSFQVSEAAAKALGELGGEIAKNQSTSQEVSKALSRTIERTNKMRGANRLRERAVEAMIPLKDANLIAVPLFQLLDDREANNTPTVRINALHALAAMNAQPNLQADIAVRITKSLGDAERGVRLEAANALGIVGSPAQAKPLFDAMSPSRETDEAVRDAAWKSLSSLFEQFETPNLFTWAETFKGQPDKQLVVYLALNKKLIQAGGPQAAELANVQQSIGALYLDKAIDKPDEAIPYLTAALNYWDSQGPGFNTVSNEELLIEAYLRPKRFKDAIKFATPRIIKDKRAQEIMGRAILKEVIRLDRANDLRSALDLLNEAKTLNIDGPLKLQLEERQQDIRKRIVPFNSYPYWREVLV